MSLHLDADRIDQDDAAEPVRMTQRHLGGDPSADRIADEDDIAQVEGLEQAGVDLGQTVDR